LDDLVGAAIQRAESVLHPHPIDVDLGDAPLLVGRFDLAQSLRILVNLLDNAAKYSPPDAPIEVAVRRAGDRLLISVSDRGAGVASTDVERIFEPFFRVAGSPADVRGTGLGLSIARRLARAQGGDLRATPRDGGGATFTVELIAGELPTE
jgi:two-component system sensor histidine kinase KdpD